MAIYVLRLRDCRVADLFVVKASTKTEALKKINKELDFGTEPYKASWFSTEGKFSTFEDFKKSDLFKEEIKPELKDRKGWETSTVKELSDKLNKSGISLFNY
jgi:hypothetical protein